MPVKFFGQFLLSRGVIRREPLLQALELQAERNRPLGAYAVSKGYLSQAQAEQINHAQRARDRRFGDLAVELGLLTEAQVDELLVTQRNDHIRIGEALLELGHLDELTLEREVAAFQDDQAAYAGRVEHISAEVPHAPVLGVFADLTEKLLLRVIGLRAKVASTAMLTEAPTTDAVTASIVISGALDAVYALSLPLDVARQTAQHMLGAGVELSDTLVADAVKELCNIICGNATGTLAKLGKRITISPPVDGAPGVHAGDAGVLVRMATPVGDVELRLAVTSA